MSNRVENVGFGGHFGAIGVAWAVYFQHCFYRGSHKGLPEADYTNPSALWGLIMGNLGVCFLVFFDFCVSFLYISL